MVSPQSDDEQFDFYLKFAKPLVLNLSDTNDRIKAAAWIRKLKDETDNATLRTDYLKLLLFVLQRRKLIGPFAVIPDDARPLQPFPEEINLQDVAKNFVEIDKKVLREAIEKGGFGEWPPYNVACSSDLKEYAASQDIPNFGVHVYFAISKDPIHNWEQKNKAIFPTGEKIESSNDFGLSTNISPNISSFVPQEQITPEISPNQIEGGDGSPAITMRKETVPPSSDSFDVESNVTPTWGSNLMKVNDDVLAEDFNEEAFNFNVSNQDMLDLDDEDIDLDEVEGISDLEDSFYLEGDQLKSPVCTPCSSPAPSLPYRSPPIPTVNLPSPAPSLPYRTPPKPGIPNDFRFDTSDIGNADMLDYMDESIDLVEDEDMFFDDATMYLQSDRLQSPSMNQPCETSESSFPINQASSPASSSPCRIPAMNLPSPAPSLPYRTPPKPGTPYDDTDMLDYMNESMDLVEDISFGDAAMYLQMDHLTTPPSNEPCHPCGSGRSSVQSPAPSLPYKTPPTPRSPRSQSPYQPCESIQHTPTLKRTEEDENQFHTSAEGLGGDSFIAPKSKDFRWLQDVSPGPGLPEDAEQDPNLWESFGWWTDDPDEIFEYIPPSPRVCGSPDPYAAERERWADVPATPPIFSRDPEIQTGPGAQRIYAIEEFGMESFEEPVWTSAEQYMRYLPDSPYQDPRDINRQTLDIAQYNRFSEINKQIFDMKGETEADYFFTEEQPPIDDLEVSFQEQDFQKITRAEALFEAMQHGSVQIGAPPSPPLPALEDQMQPEEAMVDVEFLAKTPPKFIFVPPFFSTPPTYHPNTSINADDFDESISKYVEDEIKIIQSNIPVTTPQRSPSPKRKKRFIGDESLPNIEDVDLDNENIVSSPELKTPPRYHVSPSKEIKWDTEIGKPTKISPLKPAYLGIPDNERQTKSAKRKKELAAMYKEQFASPPLVQSPVRPPHLIDEPIPNDLKSPLPPKKLPPHGWSWQSPPTSQISKNYVPRVIKTPTGITSPKKMSEDVTMFYESPPYDIYSPPPSPSSAIGALQFSPVRSPGGRPIYKGWQPVQTADAIDMEEDFPIPYEDFITEENPDLYASPERTKSPEILKELIQKTANLSPASKMKFYDAEIEALENELYQAPSTPCGTCSQIPSPGSPVTPEYERRIWKESLKLHDLDDYWKRQWVVRPKPGKTKAIRRFTVGSRLGTIPDQEEPCSPSKLRKTKLPETTFKDKNKEYSPTEEAFANIEAEIDNLKRAEEEEMQMQKAKQREINRQVMQDIADLPKVIMRTPPRKPLYVHPDQSYIDEINRTVRQLEELVRRETMKENIRERIQLQFASPPRPCNEPVIHPFDEPLPEEVELPPALLPPSGWAWTTPPKYKQTDYELHEKRTPTGQIFPDIMSEDVTMFNESPPQELLTPPSLYAATSALQHTPTCGFNIPSSPIRSPGGRPITDSWQIDNIVDEIDLDKVYPAEFEDVYEEDIPELYMSPTKVCGNKIGQEINISFPKSPYKQSTTTPKIKNRPLSPVTPEQDRQMWKEKLKLHELHEYWKKQWTVRPKPGKTRKVQRFTPRPVLHTIPDEREQTLIKPGSYTDEESKYVALLNAEMADINRRVEAAEEVLNDIADLPTPISPPRKKFIICNDPNIDIEYLKRQLEEHEKLKYVYEKEVLKSRIKERVEDQYKSPPKMPSPEPVIHPFDQSLSEELELPPALLPPSGWSWQTPPKYKLPDYKPKEKYSPRGISPDKPFSEDVTMFYESPPREFLSPTAPCNVTPPQDFSPPSQSPIRSSYGVEDDIYLQNILTTEYEYIEEDNPELYVSPTKDKSPERVQQQITPTKQKHVMSLKDQIATLECECFGEKLKSPISNATRDAAAASKVSNIQYSPETPEFKRQLWKDSLKLHEFDNQEQYPKRQWMVQPKPSKRVRVSRHTGKSKLQTISDEKEPTPAKVKREDIIKAERKMQENRRIYEEAQKQAMLDILKLEELTQPNIVMKSSGYQEPSEEQKIKLKEDIARRIREQFSSPPRDIQSEPIITHPFDEELPSDLPMALLPPSGWEWKTPPRLQHQPCVTHRIVSPTGVSPPQQVDPESLFYESPPQLLPEDESNSLEETCLPCSSRKSPLQSPNKLLQTPKKIPAQSPARIPSPPCELPPFSPIKSPISNLSDYRPVSPTQFEDIGQEFPPDEFSRLPSPPPSKDSEAISDEDYRLQIDAEIKAIKNAMMKSTQMQNVSPCTPPTPEYSRKIWQQELALRSPLQLQQRAWVVKPTPGKSYRVTKSKKPELSPVKEKYLEWSPEVVFESPEIISPTIQQPVSTPTRQPQTSPQNWTWKTPSPQTLKTTRQRFVEEGVIPFSISTDDQFTSPEIFSESPPYIPQTPPDTSPTDVCSPCSGVSPPQLTPEFYHSPGSESPVLSPDISPDISPYRSPYRSPLRSPGGRPIIPEWAQEQDNEFYFSEILPDQHEFVDEEMPPEDIYEVTLPPTPPPLPSSPRPYLHQIKLTPRTRPKPDLSMFSPDRSPTRSPDRAYQSVMSPCRQFESQPMRRGKTPESAKRPYEPFVEAVRFEPKRPTPKPTSVEEYQTPTRGQFRGPARRKLINREAPRRRLIFDDTNMEDDIEEIENLQRAMEASNPSDTFRDVYAESPPRDADISVLTEFDYEPEEFNLFEDEDAEEYNVRLPFEGHHYRVQDGSPIPVTDEIAEEERDFRWMPCNSNCQNTPKR